MWSRIAREIRDLVREALEKGESEKEVEETIFEETRISSEKDYWDLWHIDVPEELRRILDKAGLSCSLYFKTEEVPGPEYVANCVTEDGRPIALGIDVDYDPETDETTLSFVQAWRDKEWSENQLVYYTPV